MPHRYRRVLIIEDDPIQAEALARMLRRRSLEPTCAESFAEGLGCVAAAEAIPFSCIVLDLGLPDTASRMETAARISEFHPIPVVALTGDDDEELMRCCLTGGAGYCVKGADTPQIMSKVLIAIERREPSRDLERQIIAERSSNGPDIDTPAPEKKPWILTWAPAIAVTLSMLTASCIAGAYLYRSIANDALRAERTATRFELLEKSMTEFKLNSEAQGRLIADLTAKAQRSLDDRDGMHRQLDLQAADMREVKSTLDRRLETIQSGQMDLLKELNRQNQGRQK